MFIRTPAVAGMFYPNESSKLKKVIKESFLHKLGPGNIPPSKNKKKIFGIISPHAGYMYSGPIACHGFYTLSSEKPELFVLIGPNHYGIGRSVATMKDCKWSTPLGDIEVDSDAVKEITQISELIDIDNAAHSCEHSLEVQIPILQELYTKFKILPISLIDQSKGMAKIVGNAIARIAEKKQAIIIGSSDFTHYEQNEFAYEQDMALIEPILRLDIERFYNVLKNRKVSACGYGAIASTMIACEQLGATSGELLKYATSGDVTGETSSVVGYGSIVFT